jgi:hypothetical protein
MVRGKQKRKAKQKAKQKAKAAIHRDKLASLTWRPKSIATVESAVVGTIFNARWECEQNARGLAASLGLQKGLVISMNHEKLTSKCPNSNCNAVVSYCFQPSMGKWKVKQVVDHEATCFGVPTPADGAKVGDKAAPCKSAYLPRQAATVVAEAANADPSISTRTIGAILRSSGIFLRNPSGRFFHAVGEIIRLGKEASRAVDMAALPGYARLLRECGHTVSPCCPCA